MSYGYGRQNPYDAPDQGYGGNNGYGNGGGYNSPQAQGYGGETYQLCLLIVFHHLLT
jgi:syntaxin 1B/2/3